MDYLNSQLHRAITEIEERLYSGELSPWIIRRAVELLMLIGNATSDHVMHSQGARDPQTRANSLALGHDTDLLEQSLKDVAGQVGRLSSAMAPEGKEVALQQMSDLIHSLGLGVFWFDAEMAFEAALEESETEDFVDLKGGSDD